MKLQTKSLFLLVTALALVIVGTMGAAAQDAPITIEYWNINTANFGGPQVDALIASFEAANPDINVESRPKQSYPELVQDAQTGIAAGNPPDIVQAGWPYLNYVANNLPYIPLDTLVETYGGEEVVAAIPQNIYDLTLVGGEHVGLAYSLSNAVVYYNADLFIEAGLDPENPPQTIAEWTEAGRILKETLDLPINAIDYGEDNWAVENLIASNGGSLLICEDDGTYGSGLNSPEAAEALQVWADWVANGYAVNATDQARQVFWTGEAGSLIWSIAGRATVASNAAFDLRATTYPSFGDKPQRLPTGGNMLVIFSTDPAKQEAAWRFAQHLASPEGVTEWTMGTGYVPLIPELAQDENYLAGFIEENPIQQVAIDQIPSMFTWTSFPGDDGLAAGRALFEAVQSALSGQATAADALAAAHEEVNRLVGEEPCAN